MAFWRHRTWIFPPGPLLTGPLLVGIGFNLQYCGVASQLFIALAWRAKFLHPHCGTLAAGRPSIGLFTALGIILIRLREEEVDEVIQE